MTQAQAQAQAQVHASLSDELARQLAGQMDQQMALPALREDLVLHPGPRQADGAPSWSIEDPLKGRYYRIGWLEFELLQRWSLGDARRVARRVAEDTLLSPSVEEVLEVRQFLLQHELLANPELIARVARGENPAPGLATQALHHYLMFRIPLLNPDRFLERFLPLARPLLGARAFGVSALAGLLGLVLLAQQWDSFASTFIETLSLQGLLSYGIALVFAKVLHELGHAFTAKQLRHAMRRRLLGWQDPAPTLQRGDAPPWLVWFGLGTAVYRFFLFLGIALTVYHYFFKALGIFLFAVEIWWFILRPAARELRAWWDERARIAAPARLRLALGALLALLVLFMPWQGQVQGEGWLRAAQEYTLYPVRPARLESLPQAGAVAAEQTLVQLQAPELALREARASARLDGLDSRLHAGVGSEQNLPESQRSTRQQWQQQWADKHGAGAEARQLQMLSPFAGVMVDVARDIAVGQTLAQKDVLARVIDPAAWIAEVFVHEDEVKRVRKGDRVMAYVHGVDGQVLQGQVQAIDTAPVEQLPSEMLAAPFGGRLLTVDDANTPLKPKRSLYRLRVALAAAPAMQQARLAAFSIEARRVSLADSLWRGALSALMLQASF